MSTMYELYWNVPAYMQSQVLIDAVTCIPLCILMHLFVYPKIIFRVNCSARFTTCTGVCDFFYRASVHVKFITSMA